MKNKITVILSVLILLTTFAGCTERDTADAAITGKWRYAYFQPEGVERIEKDPQTDLMTFEFFEDYTAVVIYDGITEKCSWECKGSEITLTYSDGTAEILTYENEELYFTAERIKFIFTKK